MKLFPSELTECRPFASRLTKSSAYNNKKKEFHETDIKITFEEKTTDLGKWVRKAILMNDKVTSYQLKLKRGGHSSKPKA